MLADSDEAYFRLILVRRLRARMKLGITLSITLYVFGVGLIGLLRSFELFRKLSTTEMLYGPAITIASSWIIFAVIHVYET